MLRLIVRRERGAGYNPLTRTSPVPQLASPQWGPLLSGVRIPSIKGMRCKQEVLQSQGLGALALPPASCVTLGVSLSSLDLSLVFCKVRGLDGSVEGPFCSQGTKGLAVDSHLGKLQSGPSWGRVPGVRAECPSCGPQPLYPTDPIGLVKKCRIQTPPRTHGI